MSNLPLGRQAYIRQYARMPEIVLKNRYFEDNPTNRVDAVALLSRPPSTFLTAMGAGPIRANYTQEGTFDGALFTVSGTKLFRTDKDFTRTDIGGTVVDNGTPSMAGTEEYLFIADGQFLQFYDGVGSRAKGTLTVPTAGTISPAETVTLNGIVYTWVSALTTANDVLIGSTVEESLQNLADAVNATPETVNIAYGSGTVANQWMTADYSPTTITSNVVLNFYATVGGTAGNAYTTTETMADGSFGAATLQNGTNDSLSGVPTPDDVGIVSLAVLEGFVLCLAAQSQRIYFIRPGSFLIDPLDFFEAEAIPDQGIQLMTVGDQVWCFGAASSDAFYLGDETASAGPFYRFQGRSFSKGALQGTPVLIDDRVVVVGNDFVVYSVSGGGQERISTHSIEERVRKAFKAERDQ